MRGGSPANIVYQFIKDKSIRYGYKLFCLACSKTGYTLDFFVYLGKKCTTAEEKVAGVAFSAVVKLCQNLFGQGYFIFTDNFYTSLKLGKALLNKGLYLIGTVKCNCPSMPQCLHAWKVWEKKARRGDFRWARHEDDPNFVYNQWKDSKTVRTMSAIHSESPVAHLESCTRTIQERTGWNKSNQVSPGDPRLQLWHVRCGQI